MVVAGTRYVEPLGGMTCGVRRRKAGAIRGRNASQNCGRSVWIDIRKRAETGKGEQSDAECANSLAMRNGRPTDGGLLARP